MVDNGSLAFLTKEELEEFKHRIERFVEILEIQHQLIFEIMLEVHVIKNIINNVNNK